MTKGPITLKQLCFTGPEKPDACVEFQAGLNIIYGASDAGKSFILEAIDFMMGGGAPLRDIPERVGYDRIWLSIARADQTEFTLTRSTEGGDFNLYEGVTQKIPEGRTPLTLKSKHDAKKADNISTYLLDQVGFSEKRLKKKADGSTISFTLSFLRHLCIISETDIQKQGSPINTGQFITATAEMSAFKLLLTGVDDSALIKSPSNTPANQSRDAKLEVIEELILAYETRYTELADDVLDGQEFRDQLELLEKSISLEQEQLNFSESSYRSLSMQRSALRSIIEKSSERLAEIREMLQRFTLLKEHYGSDISRLEGIQEAGSLVEALAPGECPLCGSVAGSPHASSPCDANLEGVVVAANAEKAKVEKLRAELLSTMQKLELEAQSFERIIPKNQKDLSSLEVKIEEATPSVLEQRASYLSLVEKRANVRVVITAWDELDNLRDRKTSLEDITETQGSESQPVSEMSASVLDSFSQFMEAILKAWHFPKAERVYFDPQKRDFVIAGKPRGSRGKGMRAITHAAFTIALLEFCKREKHAHLGFIVMDSPLLAYREPDAADDGVTETGLNEEFFSYLSKWTDRQAIIIENVDPPAQFSEQSYSTYFSGTPGVGRAGFFPVPVSEN